MFIASSFICICVNVCVCHQTFFIIFSYSIRLFPRSLVYCPHTCALNTIWKDTPVRIDWWSHQFLKIYDDQTVAFSLSFSFSLQHSLFLYILILSLSFTLSLSFPPSFSLSLSHTHFPTYTLISLLSIIRHSLPFLLSLPLIFPFSLNFIFSISPSLRHSVSLIQCGHSVIE